MTTILSACEISYGVEHKHAETLFVNSDKHEMEGWNLKVFCFE
jgi:hypothetical protein